MIDRTKPLNVGTHSDRDLYALIEDFFANTFSTDNPLITEAVRQLRGECGPRQVEGAELACVNGTGGWFSSAGTVILGNEPGSP